MQHDLSDRMDVNEDVNGQRLFRLVKLYDPPSWVKDASSADLAGDADLPSRSFADPVRRRYPTHSRAATWTSAAYFYDDGATDPAVAERLLKAADFHGIRGEVERLQTQTKQASYSNRTPDLEQCALAWEDEDGIEHGLFPLRNAAEVKEAADYLERYSHAIPYLDRVVMASAVLEKAAELGTPFSEERQAFLDKQAGRGFCATTDVAQFLRGRALLVARKSGEGAEVLNKAAEVCEGSPDSCDPVNLVKLAALVHETDEAAGLRFTDGLVAPEDVFFTVTQKSAADLTRAYCASPTDAVYRVAELGRLPLDEVRNHFGDDFADSISAGGLLVSPTKMAEVIPTLPRPDAELMDVLLAAAGVRSTYKEASTGWSRRSFWEEQSANYPNR